MFRRFIHTSRVVIGALMTLVTLTAAVPTTTSAAPNQRERCFSETGYCVSGPILDYWERNGGLPVFGYPLAPQRNETIEGTWTGPTQWFERDRLEDHSNEGKGVLAGRLGAQYLELTGRPWVQGNDGPQPGRNLCTKHEATGYNVCGSFNYYWQNNGGLARFGYPITPAFQETVEGKTYLVQYFERRRMEYHPENAAPYDVLLGLVGREIFDNGMLPCAPLTTEGMKKAAAQYSGSMICPNTAFENIPTAWQPFERGVMIWASKGYDAYPTIFVISRNPTTGVQTWEAFTDTYQEGEPVGGAEKPPKDLIAPVRGFGKLWWTNSSVRERLGWATNTETGANGSVGQYIHARAWIIDRPSVNQTLVLLPDGRVSDTSR